MSHPAPPQIFDRQSDQSAPRPRLGARPGGTLKPTSCSRGRPKTFAIGCRWSNGGSPSPPTSVRPARMARPRSRPQDRLIASSGWPQPRRAWATGDFLPVVGDLERLPAADGRLDLAVSLLALQTVNDLPGALVQMRRALKDDGLLIAAMIGGETLTELRQSLTIAESEILGGASPRVAPVRRRARPWRPRAARGPGAAGRRSRSRRSSATPTCSRFWPTCAPWGPRARSQARSRKPLRREVLMRAAAVYAERFADPDGRLRATFDFVWLAGWAPHESQPKPLEPGSATMRLEDALKRRS